MMMSAMMTLEICRKQRHRPHAECLLVCNCVEIVKLSSLQLFKCSVSEYQMVRALCRFHTLLSLYLLSPGCDAQSGVKMSHSLLMALDLNIIPAIAAMAAVVKSCSCTFSQVKGFSTQPSGCLWPNAACERSVNSLAQIIKQLLCAVCWCKL